LTPKTLIAGEGCRQVSEHEARCGPAPSDGIALVAHAGDGPDSAYVRIGSARLGRGNDFGVGTTLYGGPGDDRMHAVGSSRLYGGAGNDFIRATDGDPDEIRCGSGRDRAFVDRGDNVAGCERVTLGWPS
jgi:Ca2+-binding RTX toxin-like protein